MDLTSFKLPPITEVAKANTFSFAELFAGIGGFRLGLERLGGRCCLTSEIDRNAVNTYRTNWPNSTVIGDISEYDTRVLPSMDLLTAGFPCQPFSMRGTKQGLASSKGQLYKELIRLLRAKQPKYSYFYFGFSISPCITE